MRKFGRWSPIISKKFPLVQCKSLKSIKKLPIRDACSFSAILVGPRIYGVNHFAVRRSRNPVISLFLSNLSKFRLTSPVLSFFFLLFYFFNVLLRYCKNSLSFCFGCLYMTPIRMSSFNGLIISN